MKSGGSVGSVYPDWTQGARPTNQKQAQKRRETFQTIEVDVEEVHDYAVHPAQKIKYHTDHDFTSICGVFLIRVTK